MPPAQSGVADYSALLLPELQKRGSIDLSPADYNIGLYQIGNNQLHRAAYAQALARPGVVVLHDAVLQHFFLGSLSEADYITEFVYNYGEWSRSEAKSLWKERAGSGQDVRYFGRPMLRRIAESSRAVIVHNPGAAALVREHAPKATVVEIPLFYTPTSPLDPGRVLQFKGSVRYLFGVFGFLRESKRLIAILKVFQRLRRMRNDVGLLIAGQFHSYDLRKAAAPYLDTPGVRTIGFMDAETFGLAAEAVDCCVNLRYPSAGETSAIAVRLMGLGKPVLATDGLENGSLPDHTYIAVNSGASEEAHLFEIMAFLAQWPEDGRAIGRRAADFIFRYHSISKATELYWVTLCDNCH